MTTTRARFLFAQLSLTATAVLLAAASPQSCAPQNHKYSGTLHIERADYYTAPVGAHPITLSLRELVDGSASIFGPQRLGFNFYVQFNQLGIGMASAATHVQTSIPEKADHVVVQGELEDGDRNYSKVLFLATTPLDHGQLHGIAIYGVRKESTELERIAWSGSIPAETTAAWVSEKQWELRRNAAIAER